MKKSKNVPAFAPELPSGMAHLLNEYREHCANNGLRPGSIAQYEKLCGWFLHNLAECGCGKPSQITASKVVSACLELTSNSYLEPVRTFLRYCANAGKTDRDYSYVLPPYKRPQPMPSVYSEEEIRRIEAAINCSTSVGKRDYAIVLLGTRLGLRLDDIRNMKLGSLDFENDTIRLVQQKTLAQLELPMVPELKIALLDYIENVRPDVVDDIVFCLSYPPHTLMSKNGVIACYRRAIFKAKIEIGNRGYGPRAFRSSLASSMVNDGIPYEAVRKTLGHIDPNAISHYAKLDIERLRFYALPVPKATGAFADFLSGRRSAR
jgi:integrase